MSQKVTKNGVWHLYGLKVCFPPRGSSHLCAMKEIQYIIDILCNERLAIYKGGFQDGSTFQGRLQDVEGRRPPAQTKEHLIQLAGSSSAGANLSENLNWGSQLPDSRQTLLFTGFLP